MDPPPTDSIDNPEAAERYRQKKEKDEYERQAREAMEGQELGRQAAEVQQRQIEGNLLRHEQAVESKLDDIKKEMKRARRQQALDRQQREFDRIRGMTCRPNGFGELKCN